MSMIQKILDTLPDGKVIDARVGLHWTAVVVDVGGKTFCGLASTLPGPHEHSRGPDVPNAGDLCLRSARELASWALVDRSEQPLRMSIGVAAINALLPRDPESWTDRNAEEVIAGAGAKSRVALIGSFPFIPRLRSRVGELQVLDQRALPGVHPPESAAKILPGADMVAITGQTLLNGTLENLLSLCSPESTVLILGPSTPLSPILFDHGVDLLSGSIVTDIDRVLRTLGEGASFRQVHKAGVRLVTMEKKRE